MTTYAAFWRGINVGGAKKVPMAELRTMLASLGFENVRTLLNSGNAVFAADQTAEAPVVHKIETEFRETFGFESKVIARTLPDIRALIALDPFSSITVDKNVRLYVTFTRDKPNSTLKLPYTSPNRDFQILQRTDREVFSVLTLLSARSVDTMAFIEEEFGRDVTTRNWNTIEKVAALGDS